VLVHPQAAAFLAPLRAMLPFAAGASLIAEDVLVMRVVAADGFALRETLVPVLMLLNETLLPKSWRL
jgi:urease accessory protein